MYDMIVCAAEHEAEIEKFDLNGLVGALTKKFGSRGLEFILRTEGHSAGVADVIARFHTGFAVFTSTTQAISDFMQAWATERSTSEHDVREIKDTDLHDSEIEMIPRVPSNLLN